MTRSAWYATGVAAAMVAAMVAAMAGLPAGISAQIAEAVGDLETGTVRFAFETRPEVEICNRGIRFDGDQMMWRSNGAERSERTCRSGLAEVELDVRAGVVRDVEVVTDLNDRRRDAVDLGRVTPGQAATYLLSLAYRGATDEGAEDAIVPAMIADVDEIWRGLLEIARDRAVDGGVRKSALFWLGQQAADAATEGLADVASDENEEQEIRNSAIFALSQRSDNEAVPVLMDLARTGEHPETRRTAMFWLAQSDDPRVVKFFEDVLLRRNR